MSTLRVGVLLKRDDGSSLLLSVECNITGGFFGGDRVNPPEGPEVEPVSAKVETTFPVGEGEPIDHLPPIPLDLKTLSEAESDRLAEIVYNPALDTMKAEEAAALEAYDDDRNDD